MDEDDLKWVKKERKLSCIVKTVMEIVILKPLVVGKLGLFLGM